MLILRPCPQLNEMALQPINRITEWPRGRLRTGAVAGWIIRCRMPLGTIGEKLDQGRPKTCTRAGGGPMRSEEHTSELQSLMRISSAVFCLKKKTPARRVQTT